MVAEADIHDAVRRLIARVAPSLPIERVILFGSRARGTSTATSDVDLLVVSPAFEGKSAPRRAMPLHLAWDLDVPVDFACYAPAEFERLRRQPSLVRVALEEGIDVAS